MKRNVMMGIAEAAAIGLLLGVCGCGSAGESAADSASTELSTSDEESTQTAENGSADIRGCYGVQGADGVTYTFEDENICYYRQQGTYSFSRDLNADGEEANLLSIQFETQSSPSVYTIEEDESEGDGEYTLRITYSGATAETVIPFELTSGSDGLAEMAEFDGVYAAYDQDGYRYEFSSDGSVYMVLDQTYEISGDQMTLQFMDNEFTYTWNEDEDNITLSGDEGTVAVLEKQN